MMNRVKIERPMRLARYLNISVHPLFVFSVSVCVPKRTADRIEYIKKHFLKVIWRILKKTLQRRPFFRPFREKK